MPSTGFLLAQWALAALAALAALPRAAGGSSPRGGWQQSARLAVVRYRPG